MPRPNGGQQQGRAPARAAWDRALQARDAGDPAGARRWLERAHRLAPADPLVWLTLGALLLELGDPAAAVPFLERTAGEYDVPAAWLTLAACHLALEAEAPAVAALAGALRSSVLTAELEQLADRIVARWALPGWCGVDTEGRIRCKPEIAGSDMRDLIGGTPAMRKIMRIGFSAAIGPAGLRGWAWYPADPDRAPRLTIRGARAERVITASIPADGIDGLGPLARPRRFRVTAAEIERLGAPIEVFGRTGARLPVISVAPLSVPGPKAVSSDGRLPVDVVIPVFAGVAETLACLDSVLATVPPSSVVHVVDDASPEPGLVAALDALRDAGHIQLHRHAENRGFPAAANTGLRAAAGRDVVLLNSDTLTPPGWLDRLRRAAYSGPDIGSATPLSNEGSIVTYGVPVPDLAQSRALDDLAQAANAGLTAELPVGVGFCLFLRRACLDQVGLLREDAFGLGYGEENDLCLRASRAGWRHVAALDVFVAHVGARSFGTARTPLQRRNAKTLNRLHPGYDALVARHRAADPLFEARRRMDALRWSEGRRSASVLLITHAEGGGVAEMVAARAEAVRRAGQRAIVLRPIRGGCAIEGYGDLQYRVPPELPALAGLLAADGLTHVEVHHLLGHRHEVLALAELLGVPVDSWVHDWASFCPRISLVGREGRYCGEPEIPTCEACVAELGSHLRERIGVRRLRARSAAELAASRRVVVATQDGARRLRRHFPGVEPVVEPWEAELARPLGLTGGGRLRVVIVGAIAIEKGYDVLLACAQDARSRALPVEFVVCGFTEDDERLMAAGDVFVTGRYEPAEAVALIRAQRGDLAFIPSVCPESWCYALSHAWEAGLEAAAFDLGAQAERIRGSKRGAVLPLALPIPAVNDALLRLARLRRSRQSPQP